MRKIGLAAFMLLAVLSAPVLADLSLRYTISGRNADGSTYTGVIRFAADGQVYRLEEASGDSKWTGLAIENRTFLALAYIDDDGSGALGLYKRSGDSWIGAYTGYGDDPLGLEVLYNGKAPDLPNVNRANSGKIAGKYRIAGTNPDRSTYTGEVEVTSGKHFFDIDRTAGKESLSGTLFGFDDAFAFNINDDSKRREPIGVVALFVSDGNGFLGVWARRGSQKLGAERWVRK